MTQQATSTIQTAAPDYQQVPRDELQYTIEVYQENILLRRHNSHTKAVTRISAEDLAHAFTAKLGFASSLLPENALWWKHTQDGDITAIWQEPAVHRLALQTKAFEPPERYRIPLPGAVFICSPGRAPWVFAARKKPATPEDKLYHFPTFNVFQNGRVCPGNHAFPTKVEEIPQSFFTSFFSMTGDTCGRSKKHGQLIDLWKHLHGKRKYPVTDLVEAFTVAQAMENSTPR